MTRPILKCGLGLVLMAGVILQGGADFVAPSGASTGLVPLNDLGTGLYLGQYEGGLYPDGRNQMPAAHVLAGLAQAANVRALDTDGNPSPAGKFVLLSVGMSNTTQEFCCGTWTFKGQAAAHPVVNRSTLVIVDGAKGGQTTSTWDSPTEANYDRVRDQKLGPLGLSEKQVQAIWLKEANAGPTQSLPQPNADAVTLERGLGDVVRACKVRYPNLQIVFLSSRIYAGYATSTLNPEPYAYETGLAVKWLIGAQIQQAATGQVDSVAGDLDYASGAAPWLAWGPYLWADGLNARSDGLIWEQQDFQTSDYTHPATPGEQKVGQRLLDFLLGSPFSRRWFRGAYAAGDLDGDGHVDMADLLTLAAGWGRTLGDPVYDPAWDLSGDNTVNVIDLLVLAGDWGV